MIYRAFLLVLMLAGAAWLGFLPVSAQVRVTPGEAKGGKGQGEPWAEVPDGFRNLKIPEWPIPTDRERWQEERLKVRRTLQRCLGELPPRPGPDRVKVVAREDRDGYTLERFQFDNGVD